MQRTKVVDIHSKKLKGTGMASNNDGGNNGGLESRVAKLEAHVEHIHNDVSYIREKLDKLTYIIIGGFITIFTTVVAAILIAAIVHYIK